MSNTRAPLRSRSGGNGSSLSFGCIPSGVAFTSRSQGSSSVPTRAPRSVGGKAKTFHVPLVEGRNHIRVTAFNKDRSVESRGDATHVVWNVPQAARPVLHVLAVGVDNYKAGINLRFARADANAIAKAFQPGLFGRVNTKVLLDKDASKRGILAALAALAKVAQPRDTVIVYLAGHGTLVGQLFHYLPFDVDIASDASIRNSAISQIALGQKLTHIRATKQVLILDACHSGASASTLGRMLAHRDALGLQKAQKRLARSSGTFLVAASTAEQYAKEIPQLGHGVLTYALLTGLGLGRRGAKAKAQKTRDGQITINGLLTYLDEAVPALTKKYHGGSQQPVQASTGQDFPLVVVK